MQKAEQKNRFGNATFYCGIAMMAISLIALGAASGIFYSQSTENVVDNATQNEVSRLLAQVREQSADSNPQEMVLNAATAARAKGMSMATGFVDEQVEALFVLDHTTGSLSCLILNPRNGGDGISLYTANVKEHLGGVKAGQADYLLVTGNINANLGGRVGAQRAAGSVCYVADASTGQVVAYSFQFNRTLLDNGQGQAGVLTPVWQGAAREAAPVRD